MKAKRTQTHIVLRLSRREFVRLCSVIDLGLADIGETLNEHYKKDAALAEAIMRLPVSPEKDPVFREVRIDT